MKRLIIGVALFASACAGNSPTAPSTPPTTQPAAMMTLSGNLTATNGGAPLSASMDFGLAQTSAVNGAYSVSLPAGASTLTLSISGAGLLARRTYVTPGTRTVNLDVIRDSGFDLSFYRQLVRNATEGSLQPLRRWARAPSIYLKTVDESGAAIDALTLASTEAALRDGVSLWTGNQFAANIVKGTETRRGQSGWLTVFWPAAASSDGSCGTADVAVDGGTIELDYKTGGGCRCAGGPEIRPRTVKHELGHALGFWHTDGESDLMFPRGTGCDLNPSARELAHAAIAYKRPVGNLDPDVDPVGTVNLAPMRVR